MHLLFINIVGIVQFIYFKILTYLLRNLFTDIYNQQYRSNNDTYLIFNSGTVSQCNNKFNFKIKDYYYIQVININGIISSITVRGCVHSIYTKNALVQ